MSKLSSLSNIKRIQYYECYLKSYLLIVSDDLKCTSEGKPIIGKRTFKETVPSSPESCSSSPNRSTGLFPSSQKSVDDDWKLRVVYGIFSLKDAGVKSFAKVHLGITEGQDYSNIDVRFIVHTSHFSLSIIIHFDSWNLRKFLAVYTRLYHCSKLLLTVNQTSSI